jgi:hypothetical protein
LRRHLGAHRAELLGEARGDCGDSRFDTIYSAFYAIQLNPEKAEAADHDDCDHSDDPAQSIDGGFQPFDCTLKARCGAVKAR